MCVVPPCTGTNFKHVLYLQGRGLIYSSWITRWNLSAPFLYRSCTEEGVSSRVALHVGAQSARDRVLAGLVAKVWLQCKLVLQAQSHLFMKLTLGLLVMHEENELKIGCQPLNFSEGNASYRCTWMFFFTVNYVHQKRNSYLALAIFLRGFCRPETSL